MSEIDDIFGTIRAETESNTENEKCLLPFAGGGICFYCLLSSGILSGLRVL